jgi:hypothetical protein
VQGKLIDNLYLQQNGEIKMHVVIGKENVEAVVFW